MPTERVPLKRRLGKWALWFLIANEVRGLLFVALLWAGWKVM